MGVPPLPLAYLYDWLLKQDARNGARKLPCVRFACCRALPRPGEVLVVASTAFVSNPVPLMDAAELPSAGRRRPGGAGCCCGTVGLNRSSSGGAKHSHGPSNAMARSPVNTAHTWRTHSLRSTKGVYVSGKLSRLPIRDWSRPALNQGLTVLRRELAKTTIIMDNDRTCNNGHSGTKCAEKLPILDDILPGRTARQI